MISKTGRLFAIALALLAQVPAFARQAPEPDQRFSRVIDSPDGQRITLQLSARSFRPANGPGPTVHLVGAVHVGDQAYYDALQTFLDAQDLVLYEGVKPGGTQSDLANADDASKVKITRSRQRLLAILAERAKRKSGAYPPSLDDLIKSLPGAKARVASGALSDGWGHAMTYTVIEQPPGFEITSLGADAQTGGSDANADIRFSDQKPLTAREKQAGEGIQTQLADALGLKFQLTAMNYSHTSWRNSDLTVDQVQALMGEDNAAADALFSLLDGTSLASKLVSFMLGFIKTNPQLALTVKIMLVETLSSAEDALPRQSGPGGANLAAVMKVIIQDRNEEVFRDLRRVLAEEPQAKSIAIFYGAGHLPDMERRLTQDFNYTFDHDTWFSAIDLDLSTQPGGPAQAKQARTMIRNMLEAQRKKAAAAADSGTAAETPKP